MEVEWLEDFLALAEHGNFSRAAEQRHLSQPAFSRRIRLLEAWVGATLVNRDTHRIALTPAGEQWRGVCEETLRRLSQGRDHVREVAEGVFSTIRFASTHALSMSFFPEWLDAMEPKLPERSSVSLVTDNMVGCERLMLQGQAHLLLCHHHPASPTALSSRQFLSLDIGEDRLVPVSAPNDDGAPLHPLVEPGQSPTPYLAYSERSGMGRILDAALWQAGPSTELAPVFTAHVATVLLTMARAGRGVAWLPLSLIDADLARGRLIRAGDGAWEVPVVIRFYRSRTRQKPALEALWDVILRQDSRLER